MQHDYEKGIAEQHDYEKGIAEQQFDEQGYAERYAARRASQKQHDWYTPACSLEGTLLTSSAAGC